MPFVIALLTEVSADFVLGSISNKLTLQIQDIQGLIVQEQKRAEEQKKAVEQAPLPVAVVQTTDGHKHVTVESSDSLHFDVSLSGEIIRSYLLRIADLKTIKDTYDLWKDSIHAALLNEAIFILGLSTVWELKRRTFWQTGLLRSLDVVTCSKIV